MAKITTANKTTGETFSAAEYNEIKSSVNSLYDNTETVVEAFSTELLFNKPAKDQSGGTYQQTGPLSFTVNAASSYISGTIRREIEADGISPISFSSDFNRIYHNDFLNGQPLTAGVHELLFMYKHGGLVSVNILSGATAGSGGGNANLPPAPQDVTVTNVQDTTATVSWSAVSNMQGYNVFVNGNKSNDPIITALTYNITGLTPGTSYSIEVKAVNAENAVSATDPAQLKTILTKPAQVGSVTVTPGTFQNTISWGAVVSATSYGLEFSTDGATFAALVVQSGTNYLHSGLTAGTTYHYRVRAINATGTSVNWSNVVTGVPTSGVTTLYSHNFAGTTNDASKGTVINPNPTLIQISQNDKLELRNLASGTTGGSYNNRWESVSLGNANVMNGLLTFDATVVGENGVATHNIGLGESFADCLYFNRQSSSGRFNKVRLTIRKDSVSIHTIDLADTDVVNPNSIDYAFITHMRIIKNGTNFRFFTSIDNGASFQQIGNVGGYTVDYGTRPMKAFAALDANNSTLKVVTVNLVTLTDS
ncbi:hypothetical protein D770_20250 [Flammeovirgaceae bacterium 311]|nr:hypothetical protein D770_20250 [Flammeovirgaceae bacterium 311]